MFKKNLNIYLFISSYYLVPLLLLIFFNGYNFIYGNANVIFDLLYNYYDNNKITLVEYDILKKYAYHLTEQELKSLINLKKKIFKNEELPWYDDAFFEILQMKLKYKQLKLEKIIDLYYEFINLRYNINLNIYTTIGWTFDIFCYSYVENIHYFSWDKEQLADVFSLIENTKNKYYILKSLNPRTYADTYNYIVKTHSVPFDLFYSLNLVGLAIDYRIALIKFCKNFIDINNMDNSVEHLWLALIYIYWKYFSHISQLEYIMFIKYLIEKRYVYKFTLEELLIIRENLEMRLKITNISSSQLLDEIKLQTNYKEPTYVINFLPETKRLFLGMKIISEKDNIFSYYNYIKPFILIKNFK